MDVDGPAEQRSAQLVGEHLHVAGQHHEVGPVLVDELEQPCLGLRLGGRGDRHVVERQAGRLGHRPQVLVVGHDGDELAAEAAGPPAEDQVVEAVAHLRHHHQHPLRAGRPASW